jgi:hypothetical protein
MKRRPRPTPSNSTQKAQSHHHFDAERSYRELQQRVAKLESIVADSMGMALHDWSSDLSPERKKPGPKSIHDVALISRRDRLIQMLESYWPELEPLCEPNPDPRSLGNLLRRIARRERHPTNNGRHAQAAEHLLKDLADLGDFLSGDRFRHDPRQIANAFAGSEDMGVWRSLKRCQAHPSNEPIGQRAVRAYIFRRNRRLFDRLSADYSLPNFVSSLRAYRGKDSKLRAFTAQYLYMCWKKCDPDHAILR